MIILGINDGHNCGACLFKNGQLLISLTEEKITRKKNEYGFPIESIKLCLKKTQLNYSKIDYISVATLNLPPKYFAVKRNTNFNLSDYKSEQEKYWYQKIYKKKMSNI